MKTMHSRKKCAMPIQTCDDIKTMCNARTAWSISTLRGCSRTRDIIRLSRNESFLKRRRLRRENIELHREARQLERILEMEGE